MSSITFSIPYVLLPLGALTQAIRNFAKSLESWLTNAMMNIPEEMVRIKVNSPCISLQLVRESVITKAYICNIIATKCLG